MVSTENEQRHSGIQQHSETARLRLRFLTPLVALIVILVLILAVSLFYFESDNLQDGLLHDRLMRTQSVAKDFYEKSVSNDASALQAIMAALRQDKQLAGIFATYDREQLLEYTQQLFLDLNRNYSISHFYFTRPDRVNLLRVHAPGRYGDTIERTTTLRAAQSQTVSYGVELGVLGTLSLRVVSPWYEKENGRLIGYVELGMEIDHVIERLRDVFNLNIIVTIYKSYLQRELWEQGMAALGRTGNWDRLHSVVLASKTIDDIPQVLEEHYSSGKHRNHGKVMRLQHDGLPYRFLSLPVADASGREVAEIGMLSNVSIELDMAQRTAIVTGMATLMLGGLLIAFFWRQAERVGMRIEQDETILKQLATRDALTGLYNRRVFQQLLETELYRSLRFKHPVSLLMIDIDHFKRVNDRYGHQAGDMVLKGISNRLNKSVRNVDHVCRYGGEELAIVLPETDLENALILADRIRNIVSALKFDIDDGKLISVNISIGVAACPVDADSDTLLISAADSALYRAKESGRGRVCSHRGPVVKPVVDIHKIN